MCDDYFSLSKKEMELMDLFWDEKSPLARGEILELAEKRQSNWKPNSVHILLNSLMEKGAVQVAGYYLNSRKLGRSFEAALTRQEYALLQVKQAVFVARQAGVTQTSIKAALRAP